MFFIVASKLLSSEHLTLEQLSSDEQNLWNSYNNADIYEFLTLEKDTIPEFQFDWIKPEPTLHCPENLRDFFTPPREDTQPQQPHTVQAQPAPLPQQPPSLIVPPTPPAARASNRVLRTKAPVDYKELHTGIKRKCKSLQRKAQVVVTKLAPGAFSARREEGGDGPPTST